MNDERDGYGEMYWTDGSIYKGEWRKGIQEGKGVMTFPDGRIKDGNFENNIFKGAIKIKEDSKIEETINSSIKNPRINNISTLSNPINPASNVQSVFNSTFELTSDKKPDI